MTSNPLLQSLPLLLETRSELFSTADLQDLQQTLAPWENNLPENANQILRDWYKARPEIRDALIDLADSNRELKKVSPSQASQSARLTNIFLIVSELSQKVEDELSERADSTKSDSAKTDQKQNND
ncbi:MAG: hypothetical protein F6K35_20170 [Okeania sp. SIO2H7]|nr:hypothetical protein [Okeania sp. SIO2H7]